MRFLLLPFCIGACLDGSFAEETKKLSESTAPAAVAPPEAANVEPKPIDPKPAAAKPPRIIQVSMRDGLRFDPPRFTARPGEEIIVELENADLTHQVHNFLIVQPGKRDEVVQQSMTLGPDAAALHFVPPTPEVLVHSQVLNPEKVTQVQFRVPDAAGIYPYVCTVPGHGLVMYGAIYAGMPLPPLEDDADIPPISKQAVIAGHGRRPFVQRIFMPDAGPAAIAVALNDDQNYCWDAGQCRLRYTWRGELVDGGAHWKGKGAELAKLPAPPWWRAEKDDFPLHFESADAAPAQVKFLGYNMASGLPTFRYRIGNTEVLERITTAEGGGLQLHFQIPQAPGNVFFRASGLEQGKWSSTVGDWHDGTLALTSAQAADFTVTLRPEGSSK